MANFAKIVIQWTGISDLDSGVYIRMAKSPIDELFPWICKSVRTNPYQFEQSAVNAIDQAGFGFDAIVADVANSSISAFINVTRTGSDEVTIEANEYGWALTLDSSPGTSNTTVTVTAEVPPAKTFELTGYTLSDAVAPCSDVEVTILENDGVSPYSWISPALPSTTLVQDIARQATNDTISVTLEDADTDQATLDNVVIPRLFTTAEINNISVVANAGGFDATVTAFMLDLVTFPNMTYSLDGIIFQSSNIYTSVVDGSYTLYINDGYGCIITQAFTVDTAASIPRANAYAIVPKANSFRFIQRTTNKYNTLENTLYQNEFRLGEYKPFYAQPYQTNDGIITTQFRTNYDELSARLVDCNDIIVDTFPIVRKSNNIDSQDKRDCIAFNRGNNQTGIYFTTGNVYDPGTTDIIDTYSLNGQLPEWGVIGNTMTLTGNITGSFVIKQVIFDSSVQAHVLVIDYSWISGNESEAIIAEVTYNRLPYEVYEFDLDLGQTLLLSEGGGFPFTFPFIFGGGVRTAGTLDGNYHVQILLSDSLNEYPPLVFDSEWISIKPEHLRTNFIEYSFSPNTGIDYHTGYLGRLRIKCTDPYTDLTPGGESTEYEDSLLNTIKLKDASTMEGEMFFQAQPRYMIEKLRLLFTHKTILINGEGWTNIEGLETVNFVHSSLKNATIKLRRNNYEEYGTDNIDIDGDKAAILQESGSLLQ